MFNIRNEGILESIKKALSTILVFVAIFFLFKGLALFVNPNNETQKEESKSGEIETSLGGIPISSISFVEIVSGEFGHYVIIHFKKNGREAIQTMEKSEYLKIRDSILANGITEIGI